LLCEAVFSAQFFWYNNFSVVREIVIHQPSITMMMTVIIIIIIVVIQLQFIIIGNYWHYHES